MAKSPGFWFFTGDWMKDPELRFCSIFARGLLVDLLCILHEAKEQGYASNPDGTPRTDEQIVDAISGGSREEKLAGLGELERSGVLSRDNRGVLFSRRVARLAELSRERKQNGSKGGSKTRSKRAANTVANEQQTEQQTEQQNGGVSVSVSDSVSDSFLEEIQHNNTRAREPERKLPKPPRFDPDPSHEWDRLREAWNATPGVERFEGFQFPRGDLVAARCSDPEWIRMYPDALARLPSCRFFDRPVSLRQFLGETFVADVLCGTFDHAKQGRVAAASSQPRKGGL